MVRDRRSWAGLAAAGAMLIGGVGMAGLAHAEPAHDVSIAAAPVITDLSCNRSGLSAYRCRVTYTGPVGARYIWSVDGGPNQVAGSAIIVHCQRGEFHSVSVVVETPSGFDSESESFQC